LPRSSTSRGRVWSSIYDVREILSEKVRAILTREGNKARDFLDVNFLRRQFSLKLEDIEPCIVKKTNFALKLYSKYRQKLKEKTDLLQSGRLFEWGEEKSLLLSEMDEADFYSFLDQLQEFLKKVIKNLNLRV
jgi:hypothetical protein